jgi:hypothetical protein
MTNVYLALLNGFSAGGMLDTAMTIFLETQYGLNSLGAGLVFLGIVVPTFFVRLLFFIDDARLYLLIPP